MAFSALGNSFFLPPGALRPFSALGNSFFLPPGALRPFSALGNCFFLPPGALMAFFALGNSFFLPPGALWVFFAPGEGFSFLSGTLWLRWETIAPRRRSLLGIVVSHGPNFGPLETCGCRRGRLDHVFVSHCCGRSPDEGRFSWGDDFPDGGRASRGGRSIGGADDFSGGGRSSDGGRFLGRRTVFGWRTISRRRTVFRWRAGRNRGQMCVILAKNDYLEPGNQSSFRAA